MSFSNWSRYVTIIVLQGAALFFLAQVGLGVWHQYELSRDAYRQYQQRTESDQDKAADEIAQTCSVVAQVNPALRNCLRKAVQAYQKQDSTNQDLQAQKDMAFWALCSFVVSAGALIGSGIGLIFLYRSLRQTRQAISSDRTIGEAQVRAYLIVESPDLHFIGDIKAGEPFVAQLKIKNTGQSPAYDVRYLAALMPLDYPLADDQGDLLTPDPASIQRGVTIGAHAETRIEAGLIRTLTANDIQSVKNEGQTRLYAVAIVTYFDVFKGPERKTKYCAYMTAGIEFVNPKNGLHGVMHEWALANVHNEST